MTKRIAALITALVIPITLIFTGCEKRMTKEEYIETVKGWQTAQADAVGREFDILLGCENLDGEKRLEFFKNNKSALKDIQGELEDLYREVGKTNPPEEFSEEHERLKKSADNELEYLELEARVYDAEDVSELAEAQDKVAEFNEARGEYILDPRSFAVILYDIIGKADGM